MWSYNTEKQVQRRFTAVYCFLPILIVAAIRSISCAIMPDRPCLVSPDTRKLFSRLKCVLCGKPGILCNRSFPHNTKRHDWRRAQWKCRNPLLWTINIWIHPENCCACRIEHFRCNTQHKSHLQSSYNGAIRIIPVVTTP